MYDQLSESFVNNQTFALQKALCDFKEKLKERVKTGQPIVNQEVPEVNEENKENISENCNNNNINTDVEMK